LALTRPALAAAKVSAARVWPAEEYTRVTFESAHALKFQQFFLKDPERLVLDLEQVEWSDSLRELATKVGDADPYIKSVRVGVNRPNVIRIVLDLKTEVKPQVFAVPPAGGFAHRLMLDLYPLKPVDGLQALLDDDVAAFGKERDLPLNVETPRPEAKSKGTEKVTVAPPTKANESDPAPKRAPALQAPTVATPSKTTRAFVVVLDPGHGGEDPGAVGRKGTREKDVVLTIARKLKSRFETTPNYRVALTRDADYFVPLGQRVQRARKWRADLFVSIHADAFVTPQAHGSSVFALSESGATSTAARWLANRENEADLIGGINLNTKDSFLARTLLDLSQTAQINDSLKLGKLVLGELSEINRLHKPAVEQAGFAVLKAPDIPSILVETAFISNPEEERKLRDAAYQHKFADAIAEGIKAYFARNPALARA
jgi:N-acetylmuramoyl-L-alanine amidase